MFYFIFLNQSEESWLLYKIDSEINHLKVEKKKEIYFKNLWNVHFLAPVGVQ